MRNQNRLIRALGDVSGWLACTLVIFAPVSATAQRVHCACCEDPLSQHQIPRHRYWHDLRLEIESRIKNETRQQAGPAGSRGSSQIVFLDFDSGDNGMIDYTPVRRDEIQAELENIYQRFNVTFTQSPPGGEFSTIVFNEGGFGSGLAEDIDFRNLNRSDNAVLNVDGLGLTDDQIVPASSLVAAHELGHLLGLRHEDMFGPIGTGVNAGLGQFLNPVYTGPDDALTEALDHVMVTGSFGIPFSSFVQPSWFSERSSVKLTLAESVMTVPDVDGNDSIASAQHLDLADRSVPNTIVEGQNAGTGDFFAGVVVVEGSLNGANDGQDFFCVDGLAGDMLNLAVLSNIPDRLEINPIDPNISVLDSAGQFVDYYGSDAFNEDEFKSPDSIIFDLILPADGQYFVRVDSQDDFDVGNYELLIYRFDGNGMTGDVNCDGVVNLLDVGPFVDAIISGVFQAKADINGDGQVDLLDVGHFVDLLVGG